MSKFILVNFISLLSLFIFGCSSSYYPKLGEIRYSEEKDQTYIIDDWYRHEGAPMSKLGFWGRILKEGGRIKFQAVEQLAKDFKIDRYPMRITPENHEEFKKLVVNVKNIALTYGDIEKIRNEEYDLLVLAPSALSPLEDKLKELSLQENKQISERIKSENFRFVSKVVIVLKHELAELLFSDISGDINWNLNDSVAKIEFMDVSKKKVSMNLSNGQIIAYQLSQICWKNGNIIETVEDRGLEIDNCLPFDSRHSKIED